MNKRLPPEAFDHYVGLGLDRSYQAVADHYGVSKRTVVRTAGSEGWPERMTKIERTAREKGDRALEETLAEVRVRHLRGLRALFARSLEGLRDHPFRNATEASRGLDTAIKLERLTRGFGDRETEDPFESARQMREMVHAMRATIPTPTGMNGEERATPNP